MPSPIQLQRLPERRKKPANKRAFFLAALLLAALGLLAMTGCSAQAADATVATTADLKRAAAGAWLYPGMYAEWLDSQTVRCLKERP